MGLGIEHRARRLAPYWAEHLERTRAAQKRWTDKAHGEWLTVLGAGRLLDFNAAEILPRFKKLRLVDADPLCASYWKSLGIPVEAVCVDISGCLSEWLAGLKAARGDWAETLELIRGFGKPPKPAYEASGDAVLSLNILSQLQIVWQDGVEARLQRRFGRRFVEARESEWLEAVRPAGQMLVEQHLAAIELAGPKFALIISDVEYLEYEGRRFQVDRWAPAPVEWLEGGWRAEMGLKCEVSPALEGIELNEPTFERWLPSYRVAWQDCWLWHIVPLGTEKAEVGKVHRVVAVALERCVT